MNNICSRILTASLICAPLLGCDDAPPNKAGNLDSAARAIAVKPAEQQAIEAAISSPETARRLAAGSPEATAVAAAKEAERAAEQAKAAPESALLRVTAYANIAATAAAAAPQSSIARDASRRAEIQRQRVETVARSATTK